MQNSDSYFGNDLSCCFILTDGIVGQAPMIAPTEYEPGGVIAIHNADFLLVPEVGEPEFTLNAGLTQMVIPADRLPADVQMRVREGVLLCSSMDGLETLRIGPFAVALRNVVTLVFTSHPDDGSGYVDLEFVSGNSATVSIPAEVFYDTVKIIGALTYLLELRQPGEEAQTRVFVNFMTATRIHTSGSSWSVEMANERDIYFESLGEWLKDSRNGNHFLRDGQGWRRFDNAWCICCYEGHHAYLWHGPTIFQEDFMATARPWEAQVRLEKADIDYLDRSVDWIHNENTWFNLARVTSAWLEDEGVMIRCSGHHISTVMRPDQATDSLYGKMLRKALRYPSE